VRYANLSQYCKWHGTPPKFLVRAKPPNNLQLLGFSVSMDTTFILSARCLMVVKQPSTPRILCLHRHCIYTKFLVPAKPPNNLQLLGFSVSIDTAFILSARCLVVVQPPLFPISAGIYSLPLPTMNTGDGSRHPPG
jgi:hypothetical protein